MRLLFDNHVHYPAYCELLRRGVDVEHVGEVGLGDAEDNAILEYAADEGRIVLTRNYADFARLVDAMNHQRREFPGVLFLSDAIPDYDGGAHVRAIQEWLDRNGERNPVENTYGWLSPA